MPAASAIARGLLAAALGAAAACAPVRMAIPDDLRAHAAELPLQRPMQAAARERWAFGPWEAELSRGWRREVAAAWGPDGGAAAEPAPGERRFEAAVERDRAPALDLACRSEGLEGGTLSRALEDGSHGWAIECRLQRRASRPVRLRASGALWAEGGFGSVELPGAAPIEIAPSFELAGRAGTVRRPTGFLFRAGGVTLGAVDLAGRGAVLLRRDVPDGVSVLVAGASLALAMLAETGR